LGKIHTHYDNLQVSRGASPEVIAAAYKALCLRYHPDKNPGDPRADKIMKIINRSYAVLSNPRSRAEHDAWIDAQHRRSSGPEQQPDNQQSGQDSASERGAFEEAPGPVAHVKGRRSATVIALFLLPGLALMAFLAVSLATVGTDATSLPSNTQADDPLAIVFGPSAKQAPRDYASEIFGPHKAEPSTSGWKLDQPVPRAPNGSAWPSAASYVPGYEVQDADGLSTVTVDNSQNASAMFVKLVRAGEPRSDQSRAFYLPANESFTMKKVTAGRYELHYQDLGDGSRWGSEPFDVTQTPEDDGTSFSRISITLYKVPHGNFDTHSLSASEF
jgi:curved DNA-binding protein CbpA